MSQARSGEGASPRFQSNTLPCLSLRGIAPAGPPAGSATTADEGGSSGLQDNSPAGPAYDSVQAGKV
eukprot:gene29212-6176_t